MKFKNYPIYLFLLLAIWLLFTLAAPLAVHAQTINTPRVYKTDTRSVALGEATLADPTDLTSINLNPANLSLVRHFHVIQLNSFHSMGNNMMMQTVTFPVVALRSHRIAAQLGIHHKGWSKLNYFGPTREQPPSLTMFQFDVAYSYSFDNLLSLGVFNNVTFAQNEVAQFWTNYTTLGVLYAPSQSISYGLVFRGLGRNITYQFVDEVSVLGSNNLRESLELGATLQFPVDTDQPYFAVSFSNEKRFGEDGILYKTGLEIYALPYLSLRGGLQFKPESDIYAPSFGIGLSKRFASVHYSVSPSTRLIGRYHQLGITIHLTRK
ncbi:hypothetical protein [Fodinibius sp. AD559]|uniref:hypothetical protein n=1 Tax=Fodinibius sp. AD559 TaxID=3424179 RepID=UPI004046BE9F